MLMDYAVTMLVGERDQIVGAMKDYNIKVNIFNRQKVVLLPGMTKLPGVLPKLQHFKTTHVRFFSTLFFH